MIEGRELHRLHRMQRPCLILDQIQGSGFKVQAGY